MISGRPRKSARDTDSPGFAWSSKPGAAVPAGRASTGCVSLFISPRVSLGCAAAPGPSVLFPKLEMRDARRLDHPRRLELGRVGAELVEEPDAAAQEHGDEVDLQLVEQPGLQVLLRDVGATRERDVLVPGGRASLLERGFDAVGDEGERGSAFLDDRLTRMMGEDEHGDVERGVVPPPGIRVRVVLPWAFSTAEHPPTHH